MCKECYRSVCCPSCPNYIPPKTKYQCAFCDDGIYDGEEYIENDVGEYAHWECVQYMKDLANFLGCEIRIMDDN